MGYQGWSLCSHSRGRTLTSRKQQLLEIWNKAKGKERDAMLWGDEVSNINPHDLSVAR